MIILTNKLFIFFKLRINEQELILEQNETFKLVFDMPTPRAHFIILFNNIQEKHNFYKTSVKFLEDSDLYALFDLIDKFRARTGNNLGDIILSFHTGGWVIAENIFIII